MQIIWPLDLIRTQACLLVQQKTAVEGLTFGGKVRINVQIKTIPLAWKTRFIDFGKGEKLATTIPWGDISTALVSNSLSSLCLANYS